MKLLLDTQIYLWAIEKSPRLSKAAETLILEAEDVCVSAASIWEACIKIGNGKLRADPDQLLSAVTQSGFTHLPILAEHAALVAKLPRHHRDPFDRLLVAQSFYQSLRLLTTDPLLQVYSPLVELV